MRGPFGASPSQQWGKSWFVFLLEAAQFNLECSIWGSAWFWKLNGAGICSSHCCLETHLPSKCFLRAVRPGIVGIPWPGSHLVKSERETLTSRELHLFHQWGEPGRNRWVAPVSLLAALLAATAVKHSDQPSTLLEVPSWQKMGWGILHKDLNVISVPGFSTLQHKWLKIGDTCPMAWNKNLDALYPGGLQIYLLYSKSIAGIKYLHISTWPTLKNNYYLM